MVTYDTERSCNISIPCIHYVLYHIANYKGLSANYYNNGIMSYGASVTELTVGTHYRYI